MARGLTRLLKRQKQDMTPVFIVPRRSDPSAADRDQLWTFCKKWWTDAFPDWEIYEHPGPDGPFNRGAAINSAVKNAKDWDVLVIIDGDVVADPQQVESAVKIAASTGQMTFAFTDYVALNQAMTRQVLHGNKGDWSRGARLKMSSHVSSIVVVPRNMWSRVHGFDARCNGWGYDDVIFTDACRTLGGGVNRVPGTVYHLHHAPSPEAAKGQAGRRAAGELAKRYAAATTSPAAMSKLIETKLIPDAYTLLIMTDGRRNCISRSHSAAYVNLQGLERTNVIIHDDSGDIDYQAWLRLKFPYAELICSNKRLGYAKAVRRAWNAALGTGTPWVFWLEDDMIIKRPVDLDRVAATMDKNPQLTQMVLLRQPWFPREVEAGGVIETHPNAHIQRKNFVEHRRGHWMNPHLVRRSFLAGFEWPDSLHSEARFAKVAMADGRSSAYWGNIGDEPIVEHIGERRGTNY